MKAYAAMLSHKLSLRTQLRWTFGLIVVSVATMVGLFVDHIGSAMLLELHRRQLAQVAGEIAHKLDHQMDASLRAVRSVATSDAMRIGAEGDAGLADVQLQKLTGILPGLAWIGLADRSGHVVAAKDKVLVGADVSKRPWFSAGAARPSVMDVHEALLLQKLLAPNATEPMRFVDVAAPVLGLDGELRGVLSAHLSWLWAEDMARDILSSLSELNGAEAVVLSRRNEVLLGPKALVGKPYTALLDAPDFISSRSKSRPDDLATDLGWTTVVRQPQAALTSLLNYYRAIGLTGLLVIGGLFVGLADRIARSFSRPMEQLGRNAEALVRDASAELEPVFSEYPEVVKLERSLVGAFATLQAREASIRELNADLERRVDERTNALRIAKDAAEAATHAKTEFLATMSHEIRSPLASVVGLTDLVINEGRCDPQSLQRLQTVQTAGVALTALVNDILDLSKVESGAFEIVSEPFRFKAMLAACAELMRPQAEKKGVQLTEAIDANVPEVVIGDEQRIRQVLINLLGNAIKFTRMGSVQLRVSQFDTQTDFSVIDTGIGIAGSKIESLFARYRQADPSIHQEFGGTGLGLAISQRLVGNMGGCITVSSEKGQGSVFSFALNLPKAEMPLSLDGAMVERTTRRLTILLADDLRANREVASAILLGAGHAVDCVEDGRAAYQAAKSRPYDLILLDIQMPGLSGIEVTRQIRAEEGPNYATRILALTADLMPEHLASFERAGMNGHASKPIIRRDLLAAIETAIGRDCAADPVEIDGDQFFAKQTLDELQDLLGCEKVDSFISDLIARLSRANWSSSIDQTSLQAHKLVGLAGMLGFKAFAERCRALEEACDRNQKGEITKHLDLLSHEATLVLQAAAGLMADKASRDLNASALNIAVAVA